MSFLRAFPQMFTPPVYLSLPGYGVDISDTSLKYVKLSHARNKMADRSVTDFGELSVPAGIINEGQITDPKGLSAVLMELREKTKADFIRVSLPEERAYIFETEVKAGVGSSELRSLLEFRLEENVPIPSREVLFDYQILPTGNQRTARVVVAAYARETIMQYYEACRTAGLTPTCFEVEAQAMARAVIPDDMKGAVMMVDFGKTRTGIGVVLGGVLRFTSTISSGGNDLSAALRKVLGDESETELTKLKNTVGLVRRGADDAVPEALLPTVSVVKDELVARMQYWHTHGDRSPARRIQCVVLCGGSANLKGLPEYFMATLQVPTIRADVWQNTNRSHNQIPPIDKRHSFGYATAIGLALRDEL